MENVHQYLFKSVKLVTDKYASIPINSIGTILEVYNDRFCEVEFNKLDGSTLYLGSMSFDDLEVIDYKTGDGSMS